jgi:glycosyltransferase involved in cell wall biosynthesis
MRVLYFSTGYTPHDHRFLSALAKTRNEVFYLRLQRDERESEPRPVPPEIEQVAWAGGRRTFRWRYLPAFLLDLRRVIHRIRPDLIHAGPIQTCAFLAVLSGFRPVLAMSWGFDLMQDADRNAWWRAVTRYTLRRCTFFTSDARASRDRALKFGMNPDRTLVFPWGVDLRHFRPLPRKRALPPASGAVSARKVARIGGDQAKLMLFCNRSWEPRYGVDVLARAYALAARENPNISMTLLGDGTQAREIRRILAVGGVEDRVLFGGRVSQADLPGWYRSADIFISPSHVDGSSVSLMEALACGIPALVSDIPANAEWVKDGENGWVFPDGDSQALAAKLLDIARNRRELIRMGRAARATARQRADWNRNFPVLLQAYRRSVAFR